MIHKAPTRLRITLLSAAFLLTLASLGVASAQSPQPFHIGDPAAAPKKGTPTADPRIVVEGAINDGDSDTGTVDDDHFVHLYNYTASQGDQLTITMTSDDGLDPFIFVLDPNGNSVKSANASDGTTATLNVTLASAGSYIIGASRRDLDKGTSSGTYTLTLAVGAGSGGGGNNNTTQIDVSGQPSDVVASLQAAGLVPDGGKQLLSINDAYGTTGAPGTSYLRMGQGAQAEDLVLNFQVGWDSAGDTSACGMAFRINAQGDHTSALISNDGKAILYQVSGKKTPFDYEQVSNSITLSDANTVTVVAVKDSISLFVNGNLETTQTGAVTRGVFAIEVYNPKGNTIVTNCVYNNMWVWSWN